MIRRFAHALTLALLMFATAPAVAQDTSAAPVKRTSTTGDIRLTYLGNAGWEITDGVTTVLVDPFLSQFARWDPTRLQPDRATNPIITPDTALINEHVKRADYVIITHGHSDHALDAGYISQRTGAMIIGHETAANLARAYGVTDKNLITVIGGEDYEFRAPRDPRFHRAPDARAWQPADRHPDARG